MFTTPIQTGRTSLLGRTPLSSAKAAGRLSVQPHSAKTTPNLAIRSVAKAEQVLEETELHVIKALNYPVPVQVQETLRSNIRASSIKLHGSGWAWLVAGSRLLLWRFVTQQHATQCTPLSLPQTSGSWNAELVTVRGQSGSVLVCSPEGLLHYWADPQRDLPHECSVDVGEGTVLSLATVNGGFILATSLTTLYHIATPTESSVQGGVVVRQLQAPTSMLSGFGRRVSSLFFGSASASVSQDARRLLVGPGQATLYLLTTTHLQKWVTDASGEQMIYDAALTDMIKDAVIQQQWFVEQSLSDASQLSLWVIDMQLVSACVAVLFAVQLSGQPEAEHGLALVQAESDVTPLTPDCLIRLDHRVPIRAGGEAAVLAFCLHGSHGTNVVAMHNRNAVLLCNVGEGEGSSVVNFPAPNSIVGSGVCGGELLLFTLNQGVVSLTQQQVPLLTAPHKPPPSASLIASQVQGPSDELESQPDLTDILKDSFSLYLDGDTSGATGVIEQHFPMESFAVGVDTQADVAAVSLSQLVLDDPPSPDLYEGGGRGAIIMLYRLEEKMSAHMRYLEFLCDTGLLDRLTCVCVHDTPVPTRLLLREHTERICAAIALKKAHNQLVDRAIKLVLQYRQATVAPLPGLTPHDLYYTGLSCMEEVFPALLEHQDDCLQTSSTPNDRSQVIISTTSLMIAMLEAVLVHRQTKSSFYQATSPRDEPGYVPWTAVGGPRTVKSCVRQQLNAILDIGVKEAVSNEERQTLWQLFVNLAVFLLDGYKNQLEQCVSAVKQGFEADRHLLLTALMEGGQFQYASELAERYADFAVLVSLCEGLGDRARLRQYMTTFKEQGFAEFLFKQYLDKGQLKELLAFSGEFRTELSQFLSPHDHLSWLHQLAVQDYSRASHTLLTMATQEDRFLRKKKTLLSLSKLSLLASGRVDDGGAQLSQLDAALQVVDYQEGLPAAVLEQSGHTPGAEPPLGPREIIELYVSEESEDELSFLCALEFLGLAYPDISEEKEELRLHIWSKAVLKSRWSGLGTDDPLAALATTFFYQVLQAAHKKDFDLPALLPDLDDLLSAELLKEEGLTADPTFQYLMRAGYEQLNRVQSMRINECFC